MNQKETKQVVETQESKEKMVVLKRSPKWWIGMAAVGGLLVGAGSGFGVGVIASQSSNNQQFSQESKRVKTKDPISNKIVKMAMLHKETSKMVAHRMADLKAVVHKVVAKARCPQGGGPGQMPQEGNGGPQGNGPENGMNQSGGQEGNQGSSKKSNKKNSKNKNKTSDSQSNKENTTTHRISLPQGG